jgi:hypothetical protein
MTEGIAMHCRWTIALIAALCLILVACGSDEIDGSGADAGDGSPTTEASPTSEPSATPVPTKSPALPVSIGDLSTLDWQLAKIDGATSYQATDERLVLLDANGEPQLTFVPRPPVVIDPDLTGTTWYLTGPYWLPDIDITLTFNQATA